MSDPRSIQLAETSMRVGAWALAAMTGKAHVASLLRTLAGEIEASTIVSRP